MSSTNTDIKLRSDHVKVRAAGMGQGALVNRQEAIRSSATQRKQRVSYTHFVLINAVS